MTVNNNLVRDQTTSQNIHLELLSNVVFISHKHHIDLFFVTHIVVKCWIFLLSECFESVFNTIQVMFCRCQTLPVYFRLQPSWKRFLYRYDFIVKREIYSNPEHIHTQWTTKFCAQNMLFSVSELKVFTNRSETRVLLLVGSDLYSVFTVVYRVSTSLSR